MELKPGYKQTEIGVIPEDWDAIKLGKLSTFVSSGKSKKRTEHGEYHFYGSTGIIGYCDTPEYDGERILIARVGANAGSLYTVDGRYSVSDNTLVIGLKDSHLTGYIANYLLKENLNRIVFGSGQPLVTGNQLKNVLIAMPSQREEIDSIVEAISNVAALITSLEKLIEKKKHIKQGVMQELLTGKRRLPGFLGEWEAKRLRDSLVFERPDKYIYWGKELKPQGAIPVLTANKSFILGYANEYAGVYNDVPAIIFDDFTTDCKYVRFPFKVKSSAIKILKPANHDVDLRFIFYTMQSTKFSIGDHKRYYISEYQHLKISLPKIDEQSAIADVIEDIEIEIDLHVKQLNKQILLKQAMMQELLTGRIRLV